MPHVVSIVYTPASIAEAHPETAYARMPLTQADLIAGHGIAGDRKGGGRKRHLNIMSAEALVLLDADGFHTGPGEMGEQIVLSGLAVDQLAPGTQLLLGAQAIVEVVEARTGCGRFEKIQGHSKDAAAGRLGVMARVIRAGTIRVGDDVQLQSPAG
jgi:MOSC domain-containing protein YiiM